jgi:ribonuclease T1
MDINSLLKKLSNATAAAVALLALLLAATPPASARGPAVFGTVQLDTLPKEARQTYALIRSGGPFPFAKDGVTFGNYENALPKRKRGYYHEFTVPTPRAKNRGARRIVCGGEAADWARKQPAACYYTDDHYATFREIRA